MASQRAGIEGFRAFLEARDGAADPRAHTLSRREALLRELAERPVRSVSSIDRQSFERNLHRRRPEPGLAPRMLWLLATAKLNQAERFGVELADDHGIHAGPDADPEMVHVILQEHYHSRLLAAVVAMFDLPYPKLAPPSIFRALIRGAVLVPERWSMPIAAAAEMAGSTLLRRIRDRGVELFADDPPVADRIALLYDEILADEVCHVGYFAVRMSPRRRRLGLRLVPLVGAVISHQTPEILRLFGRRELARDFRAPFRLEEWVSRFPGRAYGAWDLEGGDAGPSGGACSADSSS